MEEREKDEKAFDEFTVLDPEAVCGFWYSELHANWYKRQNQPYVRNGQIDEERVLADLEADFECSFPILTSKNFVSVSIGDEIVAVPYTAMRSTGAIDVEPFDGAFQQFPDYKFLGYGKVSNVYTQGYWI